MAPARCARRVDYLVQTGVPGSACTRVKRLGLAKHFHARQRRAGPATCRWRAAWPCSACRCADRRPSHRARYRRPRAQGARSARRRYRSRCRRPCPRRCARTRPCPHPRRAANSTTASLAAVNHSPCAVAGAAHAVALASNHPAAAIPIAPHRFIPGLACIERPLAIAQFSSENYRIAITTVLQALHTPCWSRAQRIAQAFGFKVIFVRSARHAAANFAALQQPPAKMAKRIGRLSDHVSRHAPNACVGRAHSTSAGTCAPPNAVGDVTQRLKTTANAARSVGMGCHLAAAATFTTSTMRTVTGEERQCRCGPARQRGRPVRATGRKRPVMARPQWREIPRSVHRRLPHAGGARTDQASLPDTCPSIFEVWYSAMPMRLIRPSCCSSHQAWSSSVSRNCASSTSRLT